MWTKKGDVKMKNSDIFLGVKKDKNVGVVDDKAVFIRVGENQYIDYNSIQTTTEKFMFGFGMPIKLIGTYPTVENPEFVESSSLVSYFGNSEDRYSTAMSLRKTLTSDSRIRSRI